MVVVGVTLTAAHAWQVHLPHAHRAWGKFLCRCLALWLHRAVACTRTESATYSTHAEPVRPTPAPRRPLPTIQASSEESTLSR